jgi:hypothetical protein
MIPKTQGIKRRSHFSHRANPNCSKESVLHKTAKYLLEANIKQLSKPTITWDCPLCRKPHSCHFFSTTTELLVEQHLGTCKPEITARSEDGDITAFVEIVVRSFSLYENWFDPFIGVRGRYNFVGRSI